MSTNGGTLYPPAKYWDVGWPVVTGCTPISAGCVNCWARRCHQRLSANPLTPMWHHPFGEVRTHPEVLIQLERWRKLRRVFVGHMSDLWHRDVPEEFIMQVLNKTYGQSQRCLFLTKRASRMPVVLSRWLRSMLSLATVKHMWMGVTVEDNATLQVRLTHIRKLREVWPGGVWVSLEPLLEPLHEDGVVELAGVVDWVVIGAESGPGARPCETAWVRDIALAFRAQGVPVFVKQLELGAVDSWLGRAGMTNPKYWPRSFVAAMGGIRRLREFPEVLTCDYSG